MAKNPIVRNAFGRIRFHDHGDTMRETCVVDGGSMPSYRCAKCRGGVDAYYERLLTALDKRAGGQ